MYSKGGRIEGVLGIDVGIADLSYFLANLRIGKSGKAFLLQKAGTDMKVVAMPIQEGKSFDKIYQKIRTGNQEKIELISAEKVDDSIISSSYKAFVAYLKNDYKTVILTCYEYADIIDDYDTLI